MERFFRTVRQQFLAPLETDHLAGIADLDQRFHTWLESEYHRSPHRGLKGATPLDTWLAKCHLIVALDPAVDLAEAFRYQATRKVYRDSTVTLDGVLFELPSTLIGGGGRAGATTPPCRRPTAAFSSTTAAASSARRAWSTPTPTPACAAPTCASIPQATMRRTPAAPPWRAPIRLTTRCLPPPPRWLPRASP